MTQLALRTNAYEKLGVREVHEGEWSGRDEFGEDLIKFDHAYDDKEIIGYFAYLQLTSGFKKTLYWTKEQCFKHAKKYSAEFKAKGTGKWADMFDQMSMKTVLKQLISKYGVLSTELQTAIQSDQASIKTDGSVEYVDNENTQERKETSVSNSIIEAEDSGELESEENFGLQK